MKEEDGELFGLGRDADATVVTTNGVVKANGRAVMGRGVALQAAKHFPNLSYRLGQKIEKDGNHVYVFEFEDVERIVVTFPVKVHWREPAKLELIERSTAELVEIAGNYGWQKVVLPRPGCGNGKLEWEEVRAVIEPLLDDRFTVVDWG